MSIGTVALVVFMAVFLLGVLPLKIAAHWVGAERTGWIICFVAGIVAGAISTAATSKTWLGLVAGSAISAGVYKFMLGTTYLRGVLIVVLQLVLVLVVFLVILVVAPTFFKGIGVGLGRAV